MKKMIALLMIFMAAGAAQATTAKVLSSEEALTLFLKNVSQLTIENENPYEGYDKTVVEQLSEALLGTFEQPTVVEARCKVSSGVETCLLNAHHMESKNNSEPYGDEWLVQFEFTIDRSKGKPAIKGNKVRIQMAG